VPCLERPAAAYIKRSASLDLDSIPIVFESESARTIPGQSLNHHAIGPFHGSMVHRQKLRVVLSLANGAGPRRDETVPTLPLKSTYRVGFARLLTDYVSYLDWLVDSDRSAPSEASSAARRRAHRCAELCTGAPS